jgi:hypothetical protein
MKIHILEKHYQLATADNSSAPVSAYAPTTSPPLPLKLKRYRAGISLSISYGVISPRQVRVSHPPVPKCCAYGGVILLKKANKIGEAYTENFSRPQG